MVNAGELKNRPRSRPQRRQFGGGFVQAHGLGLLSHGKPVAAAVDEEGSVGALAPRPVASFEALSCSIRRTIILAFCKQRF